MIFGIPGPKLFAFVMVALVCVMLLWQIQMGRRLKQQRLAGGGYSAEALSNHEGIFTCNVCLMVIMLLAILFASHAAGPHTVNPWLHWGNLASGGGFLVLYFVIRFFVTGDQHARLHGALVRVDVALFVGSLATGIPMLLAL